MPWQLIFTSAPAGLTPGRSGFCTVARDRALAEPLVAQLERMSAFEADALPEAAPVFLYGRIADGADVYGVVTCVRRAGVDYTQRRNLLAHHLVFSGAEMRALGAATPPARIARRWKFCETWAGMPPRFFEAEEKLPLSRFRFLDEPPPLPARTWERLTGDAANAAAPLECAPCAFCGGFDNETLLRLYEESAALSQSRAWEIAWATHSVRGAGALDWTAHAPDIARQLKVSRGMDAAKPSVEKARLARCGAPARAAVRADSVFDRSPPAENRAALWIACGCVLAAFAALLVFLLARNARENGDAPASAPPPAGPREIAPLPLAPPQTPKPAKEPAAAQPVRPVAPARPAQNAPAGAANIPAPDESALALFASPAWVCAGEMSLNAESGEFFERVCDLPAPAFFARFFTQTPPQAVAFAPLVRALETGAPNVYPVRADEDYLQGVSLVLRGAQDGARSAQIDFLEDGSVRLTQRFPEAPNDFAGAALRFEKDGEAAALYVLDARGDCAPLRLPFSKNWAVRGDLLAPMPALSRAALRPLGGGFELACADESALCVRGGALAALVVDRRSLLRALENEIAALGRKQSALESGAQAESQKIGELRSQLEARRARLAAPDWAQRLAPWTLSFVRENGAQTRNYPLLEFENR